MEEVLVQRWDDDVECSDCGTVTKKLPSAPTIKSLDTPEKVSAALIERKPQQRRHQRKRRQQRKRRLPRHQSDVALVQEGIFNCI